MVIPPAPAAAAATTGTKREPEPSASTQTSAPSAQPSQRSGTPARDRQRPALDLVDAPLGTEDPLVGADAAVRVGHGSTWWAIDFAASAIWPGREDEPADDDRRAEEDQEL